MGGNNSKRDDLNKKTIVTGEIPISDEQVKLVRDSWKEMTKLEDFKSHGALMMIKIFLKHPEIKHIWKFAAHLETREEMLKNPQLKSHGNNVFEAVNAAVNSLDKTESLNKLLIELGARHIRYGAKIYYFPIIVDALIETVKEALGSYYTDAHLNAWNQTMNYFIGQMSKEMN